MSKHSAKGAVDDDDALVVTVTRSPGQDNAIVVYIDTGFEPDGSDGGPGLRVFINDDDTYVGKPREGAVDRFARDARLVVEFADIPYYEEV